MLTRNEYIALYKNSAIKATSGTALFASVILAQGIVESGDGNSILASVYNNHFGIKADESWNGKSVNLNTREVVNGSNVNTSDNFRVYNNAGDSYKDIVTFLMENPRYKEAGVFNAQTPYAQADALQRAGYATDPNYSFILQNVIARENLSIFDNALTYSKAFVKQNKFVAVIIVLLFVLLIALLINRK